MIYFTRVTRSGGEPGALYDPQITTRVHAGSACVCVLKEEKKITFNIYRYIYINIISHLPFNRRENLSRTR